MNIKRLQHLATEVLKTRYQQHQSPFLKEIFTTKVPLVPLVPFLKLNQVVNQKM